MKKLLLAILLSSIYPSMGLNAAVEWDYHDQQDWGKLSPDFIMCGIGKNQSPVNIENASHIILSPLNFNWKTTDQVMINNGHTIQINVSDGDTLTLNGDVFTLQQFHFHSPGENRINGLQYPFEMHLVFQDQQGNLAVVAVMAELGNSNQHLSPAWDKLPKNINAPVALTTPIDIKALMPSDLAYYFYNGSLTTPPCSEGVRWIVLKAPIKISETQISAFKQALGHTNSREVQPLNARIIAD